MADTATRHEPTLSLIQTRRNSANPSSEHSARFTANLLTTTYEVCSTLTLLRPHLLLLVLRVGEHHGSTAALAGVVVVVAAADRLGEQAAPTLCDTVQGIEHSIRLG